MLSVQKPNTATSDAASFERAVHLIGSIRHSDFNDYRKNAETEIRTRLPNVSTAVLKQGILELIKNDTYDSAYTLGEVMRYMAPSGPAREARMLDLFPNGEWHNLIKKLEANLIEVCGTGIEIHGAKAKVAAHEAKFLEALRKGGEHMKAWDTYKESPEFVGIVATSFRSTDGLNLLINTKLMYYDAIPTPHNDGVSYKSHREMVREAQGGPGDLDDYKMKPVPRERKPLQQTAYLWGERLYS